MYTLFVEYVSGVNETFHNLTFDELMVKEARFQSLGIDCCAFQEPDDMSDEPVEVTQKEIEYQLNCYYSKYI